MPTQTETDAALLERCWRFELELGELVVERVEDVGDGMTAVLDESIPLVWDANYLVVESGDVGAQEVAAKADEVLGGLGMRHRYADARDPAWGERLAQGLEKLGWEIDRGVYQVLRREPDRPGEVEVEQVPLEEVKHVNLAMVLEEDWGTPEVAEQLSERDRRIGEVWRDRWFAARDEGGEVASCCRLIQHGGIGQVENVGTLEQARGRGLARAVALAAAQASVEDGDELTFIGAEADDWPRRLYERLGFDLMGEVSSTLRKPS